LLNKAVEFVILLKDRTSSIMFSFDSVYELFITKKVYPYKFLLLLTFFIIKANVINKIISINITNEIII